VTLPSTARCGRRQGLRLLGAGLVGWMVVPPALAASVSRGELEQALEKLLKARPELVRDALNTLEQRDAAAKLRNNQALVRSAASAIYTEAGATVLGSRSGDVTLVEFIDDRCGYCRHLQADIDPLIQGDRQLRVLVKHLPILGPESVAAAQWVLAAGQGPAARQRQQRLMASPRLQAPRAPANATSADKQRVERGLTEVRQPAERLGIDGTPALLVGEQVMRGAVSAAPWLAAIQTTRQQRRKSPALG